MHQSPRPPPAASISMESPALPPLGVLRRHFRLPSLLLLTILVTAAAGTASPPRCLDSNRRALLRLKAGLRDTDPRLSSWAGRDCCRSWSGVTCDNRTGAVVRLDASSTQSPPPLHVEGSPRWLSGLSSLRFLSMNGVDLSPVDSTEILRLLNSGLPSLAELHLADCRLSGIPHALPTPAINFTSLSVVDLSGNTFRSGTIPAWLLDVGTLVSLTMTGCGLHGAVPPALSELPKMETLMLQSNSLTGSLPSSIGKLCNLSLLYLEDNKLVGELPQTLDACTSGGPLPSLVELDLSYNRISGKLPGWLGVLKNIKYLALDSNMFSGPLPLNMGNLSQLVIFSASDNQLSGSVSEAHLTGLKNLDSFYVSGNPALTLDMISADWKPPFQLQNLYMGSCKLGPQFPTWIKNQQGGLKWLDLSGAGISDTIPTWFWGAAFSELQGVNLSSNRITGIVPESIAAVKGLTSLDLSKNRFSGNIPSSLASMANLSFLDLSDNNFSGAIPDGGGTKAFNMSAFHGNPHLCGPPTDTRCGGDSPQSGKGGGCGGGGDDQEDHRRQYCSRGTAVAAYLFLGICCLLGTAVLLRHVCISVNSNVGFSRTDDCAGDKAGAVPAALVLPNEQLKKVRE